MTKWLNRFRIKVVFRIVFICFVVALGARGIAQRVGSREASVRIENLDFTLQENSLNRGLQFQNETVELPDVVTIKPWVQALGASLSIVDVNHDGFMDIYTTNSRIGTHNALFVNDGKGRFTDRIKDYGLDRINNEVYSGRSVFFDCNGDGRRDLFQVTNNCPQLYVQSESGPFELKENKWPASVCAFNNAIAVADVNGDGHTDLILGGYPPHTPGGLRVLPTSTVNGRNGAELSILLGNGRCEFEKADKFLDPKGEFFFNSIGIGDLRNKGQADIWLATDYSSDKVFLKENDKYALAPSPYTSSTSGMNSEVMYLDGDSAPYLYISQAYRKGYNVGGNNFWHYDGSRFRDEAIPRGLHQCGWSWGGRAVDLNNDGLLDIAVTNGYISGDPNQDYWYPFSTLSGSADFIFSNFTVWPNMNGKSLSGYEQDCLYVNRGDHFENVAQTVGFDLEKRDGRAIAVIDSTNDGHQHLVVANQNGPLRYYEITPTENNSWIGFELVGLAPNQEALGAKVIVMAGGRRFARENYTTNTFATQSDPRLHFGLGKAQKIDEIKVRWSNGREQKFSNLEMNRYHVLRQE